MIRYLLQTAIFCFISVTGISKTLVIDSAGESRIAFKSLQATVSAKIVHFKWEVESESKGNRFIIEKSLDKINWNVIKEVQSLGDHKTRHTYQISNINFSEGVKEYFRILRIDSDGKKEELDVIEINQPILTNMLVLPPQKAVNKTLIVSYDSMIDSRGVVFVKNSSGDLVYHHSIQFDEGYNRIELNTKKFEKGQYLIVLRDEFGNKVTRSFNTYNTGKRKF